MLSSRRLHPVFPTVQAVGEARRRLRHLGRQAAHLAFSLALGLVGRLLEGVPGRHLVGLEVELGLEIGAGADAPGDALLAERLGRELAASSGLRRRPGPAVAGTAGRRGRGGRRGCLGDLRRSVEPTVRGGGRGQPGKAGDRHEGGRNSQEKSDEHAYNELLEGAEGQCLSRPSSTGSFPETCPASSVFFRRWVAGIASTGEARRARPAVMCRPSLVRRHSTSSGSTAHSSRIR